MSDRLTELQRQRALAQEQLAWFDREIAKESGQAPVAPGTGIAPHATPNDIAAARAADEILAQYQRQVPSSQTDIKRGCYLYALFAFGLLVIFVAGAYYLYLNFRT